MSRREIRGSRLTSYREKRIGQLNEIKRTKRKVMLSGFGPKLEGTPDRAPTDAEYAALCGVIGAVSRDAVSVTGFGGFWIKGERGSRYYSAQRIADGKETRPNQRMKIYSSGDKTITATNPDGSPYVFKTGNPADQKAELAAALRAGNPEFKDMDFNISE